MDLQLDYTCDAFLVAQMTASDSAARQRGWEAWYHRDAQWLLRFIVQRCRTLGCQEDREDILQDCFLIGFRNVSNGAYSDQDRGLRAYLVGIAKNLLRDVCRARRREPVTLNEEEVMESRGWEPHSCAYLDEVTSRIREACAHRSVLCQQVIVGMYVEGKSSGQLAVELGKNAGNVRAIAHRTVLEIGRQLERRHSIRLSVDAIRICLEML